MSRIRVYTDEEIRLLFNSGNVAGIKNKSQIVYKKEFKLWAIYEKLSHPEKTARQIFESAGFDMRILDDRTPQKRLCSWIKKYKMYGDEYFIERNKYTYSSNHKKIEINHSKNLHDESKYYLLQISDSEINVIPVSLK